MKKEKQQTSHFELRSEKVRNIVGQVPSSIVRYGITAIGMVLLCLFIVVYFLTNKSIQEQLLYIVYNRTHPLIV